MVGVTVADVVRELRRRQAKRTLRAYATALGCSPAYLSDVYRGQRKPGPKLLRALGLVSQPSYVTPKRTR